MAVSTQQLAEELQIFGLDCEDALMGKRESRTEGIPSKFHVLVGYRLGPEYTTGDAVKRRHWNPLQLTPNHLLLCDFSHQSCFLKARSCSVALALLVLTM